MKTASRPLHILAAMSVAASLSVPALAAAPAFSPLIRTPKAPMLHVPHSANGGITAPGKALVLFDGRSAEAAPARMTCVAYSPDGKWVAGGGTDGYVRLFDARSGKPVRTLDGGAAVEALAFSPDSRHLAGVAGGTVTVWLAATGVNAWERTGGEADLSGIGFEPCAAFTPDGAALAVGGSRTVEGGGQGIVALLDAFTGRLQRVCPAYAEPVNAVAVSPDGRRVAGVTGEFEAEHPQVFVWDRESGEEVWVSRAESGPLLAAAFSPDGRTLVTGGRSAGETAVHVWDAEDGALERTLPHGAAVLTLAFSPDGHTLVTGGLNGTLKAWEWPEARVRSTWSGAERPLGVFALAFSPDGRRVAAASDEGTLRLWTLR